MTIPPVKLCKILFYLTNIAAKDSPKTQKSLAFRITMQDTQSTLQDDSVDAAMAAFIELVNKKHGAALRK